MKKYIIALVFGGVVFGAPAYATTLDYRHEYLMDTHGHADRLKISHRLENNIGLSLEGKFASKTGLFENNYSTGTEAEINYVYPYSHNLSFEPAFIIDAAPDSTTYKGQVKATWKINEPLYLAARYRYGYKGFTADKEDQHYSQYNFYVGYKFERVKVEYDFEYVDTDYASLRGETNTYLHNLTIQVPINGEWVPYAEIGYVPYTNEGKADYDGLYNNDFQTRIRVGIKYNF
ncbi:oligogalacturonate-specific porin KdgM family protein [Aeromonas veronii]